jgi:tRNA(Ile)-lysidine synthase
LGGGGRESDELSAIPLPPTPALSLQGGGRKTICRPLLAVARSDVLEYLNALDQPFRVDSSNADPRFTRNRIRHELLPLLKSFNPEIVSLLGRLANQATETFDHVETEANELLARAERPRAGAMRIFDRPVLEAAPPLLVREAFRLVWRRENWPTDAMTFDHWQRLASLVGGDYPDGVQLKTVGPVVQLSRKLPKPS